MIVARKGRGRSALVVVSVLLAGVVGWAAVTFGGTWSRSDGEPMSVIVATWMRDNGMSPIVAQLEDIYYSYVDTAEVGGAPTISADLAAEDTAGLSDADLQDEVDAAPVNAPIELTEAQRAASVPLLLEPRDIRPTPTPTATALGLPTDLSRPHLTPPPPIVSPVDDPEPKEGEWQPVATRVDGIPAIYVTRVRADNVHTSYYASVMWIDTLLTRTMFIPGYEEPSGPNPYDGALPKDLWPDVLANVNGAFRLDDTRGGYYYDGTMVKPLVKGRASAVVYQDGTMTIGRWGRDLEMTPDVAVVRQNLDLIVDRGVSQVSDGADNVVWGATTDKENLAWRAALGQRKDGSLVYVGSPYLSAEMLADVLVGAGVRRAMVLDMNDWWTAGFYFRHKKNGDPVCRKLDPAISGDCNRFLVPYKRDSFQFLQRAEPLTTPSSAATTDAPAILPSSVPQTASSTAP